MFLTKRDYSCFYEDHMPTHGTLLHFWSDFDPYNNICYYTFYYDHFWPMGLNTVDRALLVSAARVAHLGFFDKQLARQVTNTSTSRIWGHNSYDQFFAKLFPKGIEYHYCRMSIDVDFYSHTSDEGFTQTLL